MKELEYNNFNLILCIETLHCCSYIEKVLEGAAMYLEEPDGTFVIADIFDNREMEYAENCFKKYFFLQKKQIITPNIKHSMTFD